jgi:glycosyltransferase involved in cell wall biosynthesis
MASGLPILTCNEAFKEVLGPYTAGLMYQKGDAKALSDKIKSIVDFSENERLALGEALREIVVRNHSLISFVGKIISAIKSFRTNHNNQL